MLPCLGQAREGAGTVSMRVRNKDVSIRISVISFLLARSIHPSHHWYAGSIQMLKFIMFRSQIRHKMWKV
jgi:hypothetical protein